MPNEREILTSGSLSLFPEKIDDDISLYQAENNAITVLKGKLEINGQNIFVDRTDLFPNSGILRINDELIYYYEKTDKSFIRLIRGFNNSRAMTHSVGSVVLSCVASLHHNSIKDAIFRCEEKTGLISDTPNIDGTLTSRVKYLDIKWFTPTARFFSKPTFGVAPLKVNFRNLSLGDPYIKSMWNFGDPNKIGDISAINPVHVYDKPGIYTVTLTIQSSDGRSSILSKKDYIKVVDYSSLSHTLAYVRDVENKKRLSINLVTGQPEYENNTPLKVEFVDQSLGNIITRQWNFGDGTIIERNTNQYDHIIQHTYNKQGIFWPELKVIDINGIVKFYRFPQPIIVGFDFMPLSKNQLIFGNIDSNDNKIGKPSLEQNLKLKRENTRNSLVI